MIEIKVLCLFQGNPQTRLLLTNFAILTGKQMCWSPFLVKLQASRTATLSIVKKRLQDMFFYESCEIFKNNFLEKYLQMAASETTLWIPNYLLPPIKVAEIVECVCKYVCGRNLTKSANFESLLTRSSHDVFVLTDYAWLNKSNHRAKQVGIS